MSKVCSKSLAIITIGLAALLAFAGAARGAEPLSLGAKVDLTKAWHEPKNIPWKNVKWTLLGDASNNSAIFDQRGDFTPTGYYYYRLATDAAWFGRHFEYALTNDSWKTEQTPTFKGTTTSNQSIVHRMCASLKGFAGTLRGGAKVDAELKKRLFTPEWREACEKSLREMIGPRGLLARGDNEYPMAQAFHLLRSTFQDGREKGDFIREERVWTLENAQKLIRAILTDPDIISAEDRWLPANAAYLAARKNGGAGEAEGAANDGAAKDPILIKDGKVFYTGGLFIGWSTTHPSLHASWDGLAIINILYSHYPQPDPTKADSIFHLWHSQPAEREIGMKAMRLMSRRLWLDHLEKGEPTWCRVSKGQPTADLSLANEAKSITDHAGYSMKDLAHWSELVWQEMFGTPRGPGCDGVQALLAICDGKVWDRQKREWPRNAPAGK